MAGKKNNATSSWSGYNHQGKVGIFLALKELSELIQKDEDFCNYSVQFEKEDGEDIDIVQGDIVISRHQVKAKTKGKYPNDYVDVLIGVKKKVENNIEIIGGFNTDGVNENSRYLHTVCYVEGFGIPKKNFEFLFQNQRGAKPRFVENPYRIKLYQYPDGKKYCGLSDVNESKIDGFCEAEIKKLLAKLSPNLKNDDEHIKETLFELKDLLCTKIRKAHETGRGSYPVINFSEIYTIIISIQKREKRAIHTARNMLERYWNLNSNKQNSNKQNIDASLITDILNLPDKGFQQFLIDLHPQKDIKGALDNQTIFELLDQDIFEEIFCEFYKNINQDFFDISELRYNSTKSSFRLSLINKNCKNGEVGELVQRIRNNEQFLKASFDVDYLVNGRINSPLFEQSQLDNGLEPPYSQRPSDRNRLFSNHLEFIDIDKTVKKLIGEQYE